MLTESNPKTSVSAVEHFTGHECIENGCAGQRHTEVKAKQPPVFPIYIELRGEKHVLGHLPPNYWFCIKSYKKWLLRWIIYSLLQM